MSAKYSKDPTVGNIEADVFDPATWKTEYPHPAFLQMDAADAFWAARIVSRFTDEMIRNIVEEARLSHRDAAAFPADVIIRRRDKVVRYGITLTNPLDSFEIGTGPLPELTFDNAGVRLGLVDSRQSYRIQWSALDNGSGRASVVGAPVTSAERRFAVPDAAWGPRDGAGMRYAVASIATVDPGFAEWASAVDVTVRERGGLLDVVGIDRSTDGKVNAPDLRAAGKK